MLFASFIALGFYVITTDASPYVISDDRARSLDITPVLGRGYSIGTNSYQSTCLIVNEVTTPSYNYDYEFTDFSKKTEGSQEAEYGAKLNLNFAYYAIKAKVDYKVTRAGSQESSARMITSTMRIERYYSSVREELSSLSDDALTLLDRQDYIGFFKSCGPNYIRSIRRAQEITAIFEFNESSSEKSSEVAVKIQATTGGDTNKLTRRDVKYLGCFKDSGNRALPVYKGSGQSVSQCAVSCRGYKYLGRQWTGQCFCANSGYDRYGVERGGCNCNGRNVGGWRNCVYAYVKQKIDVNYGRSSKTSTAEKSMVITILGFGLGLGTEGSSTLTSTNLEEYQDVMKFAFKSFTQNEDSHNIGMVYGFELVPWVDNTSFQVNSKLMDEEVIIPLPRSMIPKATQQKEDDTEADVVWTNDEATRAIYACKNAPFNMDKYGYCCESNLLWNPLLQEYSPELQNVTVSERFCRPASKLDKSVVKNNMSNNGEFVAHLDSLVRMKINNLFTLERCISMIRTFPVANDYNLLKHQDSVEVAGILEMDFTVKEMRLALDPLNNFSLLRAVGEELDEWVDMYYQPCVAALFGMNVGSNPDVESQYFLAYGWLSHSACMRLSCLADNMRWDRKASGGGCTTSLLVGYYAENYQSKDSNGDADALCKKDNSNMVEQSEEACKYDQEYLFKVQSAHNQCFACGVSPAFILNEFCMPQLTEEIAFGAKREDVDSLSELCPYHEVGAAAWDPGAAALPVIACHTGESDEDLGIGGF